MNNEELREFYQKARFILPTGVKFRHFDFRFGTSQVRPVGRTIRTPYDLKKEALRQLPTSIYVSKHQQLQPVKLSKIHKGKRRWGEKADLKGTVSDDILLAVDLLLDFDLKHFSDYATLHKEAAACAQFLVRHDPLAAQCSFDHNFSGRGDQVIFYEYWKPEVEREQNVKNRFNMAKAALMRAYRLVRSAGFRPDQAPTLNPRNVYRVVGSLHHVTMKTVMNYQALSVRRWGSITPCSVPEFEKIGGNVAFFGHQKTHGHVMTHASQEPKSQSKEFSEKEQRRLVPSPLREAPMTAQSVNL